MRLPKFPKFPLLRIGGLESVTKSIKTSRNKGGKKPTKLQKGDFFRHHHGASVFLAVEPRVGVPRNGFLKLDAVDIRNGNLFFVANDPVKVFRKVFFEPTGKAMKIDDMDSSSVFMTPTDMVIISTNGFYSIGGSKLKPKFKGKDRFPIMEIVLDDPR